MTRQWLVLFLMAMMSNYRSLHFGLAWTILPQQQKRLHYRSTTLFNKAVPGADIDQPPLEETTPSLGVEMSASSYSQESQAGFSSLNRGKVNEIDFCIAPADVSLSRAYGMAATATTAADNNDSKNEAPVLSLTRALNNASNRAVRRILLARSWPSAEALNLSLRQVAAAQAAAASSSAADTSAAKCPVPRPILNVLTRRRKANAAKEQTETIVSTTMDGSAVPAAASSTTASSFRKTGGPAPRSRTDAEYVADQLAAFSERYSSLPGYAYAEAYLESILSLATSGLESARATQVLESSVYDEAYKRMLSVLKSVGVVFEVDPESGRRRIAAKLVDQDICLSTLDKIQMRLQEDSSTAAPTAAKEGELGKDESPADKDDDDDNTLTTQDLGGVLLSAKEPTMTRQLNVLSNIVQKAVLFGGDQELLVLAETLDADRSAFCDRWYPDTGGLVSLEEETRPGLQFFNCLVELLRKCYQTGVVTDLDPPLKLATSYANAYERLVASAVELGSGYLKPSVSNVMAAMPKPRTAQEELGRFAVWESTFRQSPSSATATTTASPTERQSSNQYPEDLEGTWQVRDEIGSETIGISTVVFGDQGNVIVAPPLEGLRWRLDPGPTHLDTCTFQVLSSDGTILQYRGFLDRGARLEARFSKRPLSIRGSVVFQMRDGSIDYYKDMLPINYRTGTTKFVMTKQNR